MNRPRRLVPVLLAAVALSAAALVSAPARSQTSPPPIPHGNYGGGSASCESCHDLHKAPSDSWLLTEATEKETCYTCHDGTGGATDIEAEFGEAGPPAGSSHPVPTDMLQCSSCHTPHKASEEDTGLLRTGWDGDFHYSPPGAPLGNAFCYACHDATSPLPAPNGAHDAFETSVHNTDANVPLPASGSEIKCLACHEPHGSDQPALGIRGQVEEDACFACHTSATPRTSGGNSPPWPEPWPGSDIVAAFGTPNDTSTTDGNGVRIFHHPIAPGEQGGGTRRVECSSCHNSHLVDADDTATASKISDPRLVRFEISELFVTWDRSMGYMNAAPEMTDFCTSCHVNASTTSPIDAGTFVPFDIRLVNDTGADADGRTHDSFTAAGWAANSPHAAAGLTCTACHDFHGSTNASMLRERIDDVDSNAITATTGFTALDTAADQTAIQGFCLSCHQDRGTEHGSGKLCTQCHSHATGRL
jgi:predicted CXXCH cytochrome family protein